MFTLKGKQDGFRLLLPKDFICEEITEKYTKILQAQHSFITSPIDFVNETIQKVEVLGFNGATVQQQQPGRGVAESLINNPDSGHEEFMHSASEFTYRNVTNPLNLIDKTINIEFRHTLGFVNYFLLFENFFYQYSRDRKYRELIPNFSIDIFNDKGVIYSRIVIDKPIIDGIDMLSLDYTQPIAQSSTFKMVIKYSNFDFQFINIEDENNKDTD